MEFIEIPAGYRAYLERHPGFLSGETLLDHLNDPGNSRLYDFLQFRQSFRITPENYQSGRSDEDLRFLGIQECIYQLSQARVIDLRGHFEYQILGFPEYLFLPVLQFCQGFIEYIRGGVDVNELFGYLLQRILVNNQTSGSKIGIEKALDFVEFVFSFKLYISVSVIFKCDSREKAQNVLSGFYGSFRAFDYVPFLLAYGLDYGSCDLLDLGNRLFPYRHVVLYYRVSDLSGDLVKRLHRFVDELDQVFRQIEGHFSNRLERPVNGYAIFGIALEKIQDRSNYRAVTRQA